MDLARLARLLSPSSLAVVGANENLGMSNNVVRPMLEAGRQVHLVNPTRETLYGQPALPDLASIGEPVDAVLALVNAERSVAAVEEAAALGCGGVVVAAAGFGEMGPEGLALQARLRAVATETGVAVIGPNCSGFKNVPLGVNFFTGGRIDLAAGGVSIVSQSGFLVRAAMAAALDRQLGVSIAVSSGNEAVCDLADHLAVLVDDPATTVICLVIETIRQPERFFAVVARARAAGKPVIALKLGRSARARRIMQSHTGAIADESWVYDLAFAEHGVIGARDIDQLLDAAQVFAQLPPARQAPVGRIAMITSSGGVAALATDLAEDVGAPLPPLEELDEWVRERVPGDTVNPLDLTGFVMSKPELMQELFERYAAASDALVLAWWLGAGDEGWATTLLGPFAAAAARSSTPFIVSPVEATSVGPWVERWREQGLVTTRGVLSAYRALQAMDRFHAGPPRAPGVAPPPGGIAPALVDSEVGPIVPFDAAMALLTSVGISVAPYVVIAPDEDPGGGPAVTELGDALVVKLADVPHRTELDAVRVGVPVSGVEAEVRRLRAIAQREGVPATVAVQAMVAGHGEAFLGLQGRTAFGPVLLCGMGGVQVETSGQVAGRLLPLDPAAAGALAHQVAGPEVFARLRGRRPWALDPLARAASAVGDLWAAQGAWIGSLDINPLIVTDDGVVAVDALVVAFRS